MQSVRDVMRGDEDEEDPKKPHPISVGRKGENAVEAEEHGLSEVNPDDAEHDDRYQHVHVRC